MAAKKKQKSLDVLAAITGIGAWRYKDALGIPQKVVCKEATIEGARRVFRNCEASGYGGPYKKAALKRWDELALVKAKKARTFKQAQEAVLASRVGSRARTVATAKIDQLLQRDINKAQTIGEVWCSMDMVPEGSRTEKVLCQRLTSILLRDIRGAASISRVMNVMSMKSQRLSPSQDRRLEKASLRRMYQLYMAS